MNCRLVVGPVNGIHPVAGDKAVIGHPVAAGIPDEDGVIQILFKALVGGGRGIGGNGASAAPLRIFTLLAKERGAGVPAQGVNSQGQYDAAYCHTS